MVFVGLFVITLSMPVFAVNSIWDVNKVNITDQTLADANNGDTQAMINIGIRLMQINHPEEAIKCFHRASEKNDPNGTFFSAMWLYDKADTETNSAKKEKYLRLAIKGFTVAASAGVNAAYMSLAACYYTLQDEDNAAGHWGVAYDKGFTEVEKHLYELSDRNAIANDFLTRRGLKCKDLITKQQLKKQAKKQSPNPAETKNKNNTTASDSETSKNLPKWAFNGHAYQLFNEQISWPDAEKSCEDMGGYLACIELETENIFLYSKIKDIRGSIFIGATDKAREGDWKWVNGSILTYSNWIGEQPNPYHGDNHWAAFNPDKNKGRWATPEDGEPVYGFICEWDSETTYKTPVAQKANKNSKTKKESKTPAARQKSKGAPEDAEQGDAEAQYALAISYNSVKNHTEAVKWFRKAAEQGHEKAQLLLGLKYSLGDGVEEDEAESLKWIRKAAKQGNEDAQAYLKRCYPN